MENSIDAGADNISINVEEYGLKKITVKDNGSGIFKDDIPLAIAEHATSKIADINDIYGILSYGFRGEALSSIASVAKLTLLSRTADSEVGGKLIAENNVVEICDYAGPVGTVIIVENLFYTTPARKKFLKSPSSELKSIRDTFTKLSIPNFNISFSLTHNDKNIFSFVKTESLSQRLEQIYGVSEINNLYFAGLNDLKIRAEGYFSKPDSLKSNSSMQMLFVNNRYVDYKNIRYHLMRAYEGIAFRGQYPAGIIFFTIEPSLLDINIHPAKREIKFFDNTCVDSMIYNLAKKCLSTQQHKLNITTAARFQDNRVNSNNVTHATVQENRLFHSNYISHYNHQPPISYNASPNKISLPDNIKILGIVFGTYILSEINDRMTIVDYHAACERFIYDELMTSEYIPYMQNLIFPITIEMHPRLIPVFHENLNLINSLGFNADIFSDDSIIINGIPAILENSDIKKLFSEMISSLDTNNALTIKFDSELKERIACHSARRANDNLNFDELHTIIEKVFSGKYELQCPHGRPFIYYVEKNDFEKLFMR